MEIFLFKFLNIYYLLIFFYYFYIADLYSETVSQTGTSSNEDNTVKESGKFSLTPTTSAITPKNLLASTKRGSNTKKVKNG